MGLSDLFNKKKTEPKQTEQQADSKVINDDLLVLDVFKEKLEALGYKAEYHPEYLGLLVDESLEVSMAIIKNPNLHPLIMHLMVLTAHSKFFPNGIIENIVGLGDTLQEKVDSATKNYITTTFSPIIESFKDSHYPALDFTTHADGKEILWHPKLGDLSLQGKWSEKPHNEILFELLKEKIKPKLTTKKFNWLKLYISKRKDGAVGGECLLNNEPWGEGLHDINVYAETWNMDGDFKGMKQFIMFRKCDACDD